MADIKEKKTEDVKKPEEDVKEKETGDVKEKETGDVKKTEDVKEKGDIKKTGKCDNIKGICPFANIAESMHKPASMRDAFKVNLKETIHEVGKKAIKALNNPKECIINYNKSTPNVVDTLGTSLTKAVQSVWKVTNLGLTEAIEKLNSKDVFENVAMGKGYYVATSVLQKKVQDKVNQVLLGDNAEEIMAANPNPELLLAKVLARHAIWKETFELAEFQGILKPWINDYVNMLRQTLDLAQDPLQKFKGEIDETIQKFGGNLGEVLSKTLTNLIITAVAEIPGVGPLGVLVKTIDEAGKSGLNACEEPIAKGGQVFNATVQTLDKQQQILKCRVDDLAAKAKPMIAKVEAAAAAASAAASKVGGGGKTHRLKQKIHNTKKRVNALLQRFTTRKKKLNYTQRLNRHRRF
jgi:hypothetical protein